MMSALGGEGVPQKQKRVLIKLRECDTDKGGQGYQIAKFDPFLSLDCAQLKGRGNPRK